jgi:hypothetical protein
LFGLELGRFGGGLGFGLAVTRECGYARVMNYFEFGAGLDVKVLLKFWFGWNWAGSVGWRWRLRGWSCGWDSVYKKLALELGVKNCWLKKSWLKKGGDNLNTLQFLFFKKSSQYFVVVFNRNNFFISIYVS